MQKLTISDLFEQKLIPTDSKIMRILYWCKKHKVDKTKRIVIRKNTSSNGKGGTKLTQTVYLLNEIEIKNLQIYLNPELEDASVTPFSGALLDRAKGGISTTTGQGQSIRTRAHGYTGKKY